MNVTEALQRACALLASCHISLEDAPAAGEAMSLLAACISALNVPIEKEESK